MRKDAKVVLTRSQAPQKAPNTAAAIRNVPTLGQNDSHHLPKGVIVCEPQGSSILEYFQTGLGVRLTVSPSVFWLVVPPFGLATVDLVRGPRCGHLPWDPRLAPPSETRGQPRRFGFSSP